MHTSKWSRVVKRRTPNQSNQRRTLQAVRSQPRRLGASWVPSPIVSNLSGSPTADYDYGPAVGRATALFVDPTDATGNTVYLGGATGGLWRSTNAAATIASSVTWSPLLDGQPTLSVGASRRPTGEFQSHYPRHRRTGLFDRLLLRARVVALHRSRRDMELDQLCRQRTRRPSRRP